MKNILRHYLRDKVYSVGFCLGLKSPFDFDFANVRWLNTNGYKNGWFADPFILDVNDKLIYVLAEEFVYDSSKGRIVKLIIRKSDLFLLEVIPILELESHLSFPIIYRQGKEIFIYPENSENNRLDIYKFDGSKNNLEHVSTLISEPLVDTQIIQDKESYVAMGVKNTGQGLDSTKLLGIYYSSSLCGQYALVDQIVNDKREERGAGQIFSYNNKLYRPAQCCEHDYGESVIIYELIKSDQSYTEKEVCRFCPEKAKKNGLGLHTFNYVDGLAVVDGIDFKHRILGRLVAKLFDK